MASVELKYPPDGDVDLRARYMAGIVVMTVIAVLTAWLRLYTRVFVSRNLWWDDWTMFVASLITIVTDAFLINAYHLGLGRHIVYVPPGNISETFKWLWAAEPTNLFAVFLVRLSIALFFLRLVPPKRRYIWTIWIIIGILAVSDIYISINFFFECRPIRKVWLPDTPGTCFSDEVNHSALWLFQIRWQHKDSKDEEYVRPSKSSAVKLDSYGKRSPKMSLGPKSQYSITKSEKASMPLTSKERMVSLHNENRILKTQDIEVSYKAAGPNGENSGPHRTEWRAV
ncbi:MAG: hypothetical protein L6R41_005300 [Letrouitia leprolyta]|nr:MAG: hypothetical protein L6R41_005300 [Letrouitia leprolyta]